MRHESTPQSSALRRFALQLPRLAPIIDPVPIKHAVGGVAVLLNLNEKIACANGMKSTGRQKHCVAWFHFDPVDVVGGRAGVAGDGLRSRAGDGDAA